MLLFNDLINISNNKVETVLYTNLQWKDYKLKKTFEDRKHECDTILNKYPDKLPVIINECSVELRDKIKRKMLIQKDMTVGQYMHSVRTKFNLKSEDAVLMFVNGSFPSSSTLMSYLHDKYKDKDGFLYVSILKENVFG
jgi:GABA(A) receptor-associated protein